MSLMQVKRIRPTAVLPVRGSEYAAGFDLSAAEPEVVPACGKAIIKTGLSIAIPEGTYARIAPRSGLAAKKMLNCGAGVVDYDYRGEVGVVLFNHGTEDFTVTTGDRVAQLILEKVSMVSCIEVESLGETARGTGGYGSTGVAGQVQPSLTNPVDAAAAVSICQQMQVRKNRPEAVMPVRGSEFAAGFDLAAAQATIVPAGGKAIVSTGLSIAIPEGTYARIAPRSGLAAKKMLQVGAGVVDYDYRGEVGVVLFNHGTEDFPVAVGDRIAQLILEQVSMAPCIEVETLDSTERGAGGFGSTGVSEAVESSPAHKRARQDGAKDTPEKEAQPTAVTKSDEVDKLKAEVDSLKKLTADIPSIRSELQELRSHLLRLKGVGC